MSNNLYLNTLGSNIKKVRKERNLSQEALSEKTYVAQSTLSYLEKGVRSPTVDTLLAICNGLSISLLDLLMMDDNFKNGDEEFKNKVKAYCINKSSKLENYKLTVTEDFEKYMSERK